MLLAAGWTLPQAVRAQQPGSLDEELLEQLNTDPPDEVDREPLGRGQRQGRAEEPADDEKDDLQDRLRRELGAAAVAEDQQPLLAVARKMRRAEGRIAEKDPGDSTRKLQRQIVADIDELIQQLRRRCRKPGPGNSRPQASRGGPAKQPKPGSGRGNPGPGRPPNPAGTAGNATPRRPDMKEMQQVIRELWGILPKRDREQVVQPPIEEFLPKYEILTEEYFRRLAEENSRNE